jgi:hypothetical protein
MRLVNWGEVYYATWRDRPQCVASRIVDGIAKLPGEIEAANDEATRLF